MTESTDFFLSPDGQRRRDEILRTAKAATRRRRRLRSASHVAGVGTLALALTCIAIFRHPRPAAREISKRPDSPARLRAPAPSMARPSAPPVAIIRIRTDPTLLSRLAVAPEKPKWRTIDDDELLRSLAEAGKPAGLAYVDGRTLILFRDPARR